MVKSGIVAFGDELGLSSVLDAVAPDLIVFDPHREDARAFCETLSDVCAQQHPDKGQVAEFVNILNQKKAKLGVVSSYSRILPPEVIDAFPLGVVNLHLSRLPEYRGANTLQWTLINGETQTDATLHYIDAGIDTGPVIARKPVDITSDDTAVSLQKKLLEAGATLLKFWLPRLALQKIEAEVQDESKAKYWPRRRQEDGRIDLHWDSRKIVNMARALVAPWPGIEYIDRDGNTVVIDYALSLSDVERLKSEQGVDL